MARSIKRRGARGYQREVESLTRLRSAITLDPNIDTKVRHTAMRKIDALIEVLKPLVQESHAPVSV